MRRALALSFLAHFCMAFIFAGLLNLIFDTEPGADPTTLEFVFLPADENDNFITQARFKKRGSPKNSQSPKQHLSSKAVQNNYTAESGNGAKNIPAHPQSALLPQNSIDFHESPASPAVNELDISNQKSELRSTFEYAPVFHERKDSPDIFDKDYQLQWATLPVSVGEKEKINDKLHDIIEELAEAQNKDTVVFWEWENANYTFDLDHTEAESAMELDEIFVKITRKRDGISTTTAMRMRRMAFSHYAKFVDYWNPLIVLHDDEFDGRFHSNSTFNIMNIGKRPKFRGKVTTASHQIKASGTPYFSFITQRDSVFRAGLETGVGTIKLPRSLNISVSENPDSLHYLFSEETWITFHSSGEFSWKKKGEPSSKSRYIPKEPITIAGFKKAKLHLRGIISGKMMVYSSGDIIIDGSLTYKKNPMLSSYSEDYLGVVSEKDIIVAEPKITGPGDLILHGAFFAQNRFRIRKFWHENNNAKLRIYGSITAGSVGATEPRYGTRIQFDKRLEQKRPPYFPMTDRYEVDVWDELWHTNIDK
ncbi:MAG: hypothetical protein DWQ05_04400 [Calditrichaeota bacterium]|nr:MAG: hypothetical protein DWQ05_04400 [Calditrichota bacterium]